MENLNTDITESLQEYDLTDIIDALVQLHGRVAVADALLVHMPTAHYTPTV